LHQASKAAGVVLPPFQADVYFEGSDQHRGWFQSSLLLSLAANGAAPYRTVMTHGFMVDADREKISKSKQGSGGYSKPQTADAYVRRYGTDVLRLWVASQDFRNDVTVSEDRINKVGEAYRVIRNALRYQLSNLYDFEATTHGVPDDRMDELDRWILGEFWKLETDVLRAYEASEFHVVFQRISQFAAVELSAIYHDVVKDRLYTDPANSARRRSTQTTLHRMVSGLCRMLGPILVFTADEAWEFVPGHRGDSVHLATWERGGIELASEDQARWISMFAVRNAVLPELEKARQAKRIGKALEAQVRVAVDPETASLLKGRDEELRELTNVSMLELVVAGPEAPQDMIAVEVTTADGQKCARCWHWETDVGCDEAHPTLCGRCVRAVDEFGRR
jgi:isoleucyl-tRNA synthetase